MGSINSYPQYRSYFGFDLTKGTPTTGLVYASIPPLLCFLLHAEQGASADMPSSPLATCWEVLRLDQPQISKVSPSLFCLSFSFPPADCQRLRTTFRYADRKSHHHYWRHCPSNLPQLGRIHVWTVYRWIWRRNRLSCRSRLCVGNGTPSPPRSHDCYLQLLLVYRRHTGHVHPVRDVQIRFINRMAHSNMATTG
jgi:hypothetical protein